jgi:lysine-specific demethylase 3
LTDRDALRHFRWHWARGEPVVVRGIEPAGADWSPETLERALRDGAGVSDISGTSGKVSDRMVPVVDACKESTLGVRSLAVAETMTPHDFFKGFQDQRTFGPDAMYRMDGWPSEAAFKRLAPRHRSAVLAGLPFQEYTNPVDGPLNLITHVAKNAGGGDGSYPGDGSGCGPRTRVAYGRVDEVGGVGDAVSQRLRTSSADTVEVLYHASSAYVPGDVSSDDDEEDEAAAPGAVWHVFARSHEAHLVRYLSENGAVLAHPPDGERRRQNGSIGTHTDAKNGADRALAARLPLHDGRCFLTSNEIDELGRESGGVVKPWVIYQKPMEAILVPAGCARQTRNLKSCVGVAVDFASPESAGAALRVGEAMRELPGTHAERTREGVHARTTVLHAAHWAVTRLESRKEDSSA